MEEKRCYHRMKVKVPMTFLIPPQKEEIVTSTLDISGLGVSFMTTEPLIPRHELLMHLMIPDEEQMELHARVLRVDPVEEEDGEQRYRVAVKIVEPIKFDEREFVRFYAAKLKEFFGKK